MQSLMAGRSWPVEMALCMVPSNVTVSNEEVERKGYPDDEEFYRLLILCKMFPKHSPQISPLLLHLSRDLGS